MKTLIILILGLGLSGCATIGSGLDYLGGGTQTTVWHVEPDKTAQFKADQLECYKFAAGRKWADSHFDNCLQLKGYRLEIVNN